MLFKYVHSCCCCSPFYRFVSWFRRYHYLGRSRDLYDIISFYGINVLINIRYIFIIVYFLSMTKHMYSLIYLLFIKSLFYSINWIAHMFEIPPNFYVHTCFLLFNRIKFITKQLGLLRTLEYFVESISKKSMLVISEIKLKNVLFAKRM
jgi:hypothetical protein